MAPPRTPATNVNEGRGTPTSSRGLREQTERDLAESVRQLRAANAGQQLAAQNAAVERRALEATLREERELAAQAHAQAQEELKQERTRLARLLEARSADEIELATARQRLETAADAAKRHAAELEARLVDALARAEAL